MTSEPQPTGKPTKPSSPGNPSRARGLGKGLDALIPRGPQAHLAQAAALDEEGLTFFLCHIDQIRPNPYQMRRRPEEGLEELAASIREKGVLEPLIVRPTEAGFTLIAGERRLLAAKTAGLDYVPVIVKDISDTEQLELAIIENIQRQDLNPLEEATAYRRLMEEFGLSQQEVARRCAKNRATIANFLRLLNLPKKVQDYLAQGSLSAGHAKALLALPTPSEQLEAARLVVEQELSVRQAEALAKRPGRKAARKPRREPQDLHLAALAEEMMRQLGTKVRIRPMPKKGGAGRIEIEYYSDEDLERIMERIQG